MQTLERVQVDKQVLHLLPSERLSETRHLRATIQDDVADPIVIGRHAADRQILLLENPLQAWSLFVVTRIRLMAAVAIIVVDFASRRLLWRQS